MLLKIYLLTIVLRISFFHLPHEAENQNLPSDHSSFLTLRKQSIRERNCTFSQKDTSSFMVIRVKLSDLLIFEYMLHCTSKIIFYLPSLGTLRVETDWEILLPGESLRAWRLGIHAPQPPLSNLGWSGEQKPHSTWQSKSLQSGSKNGIIFLCGKL